MPKVSLVVPIYNVHKYLYKCLDSLAKQSYDAIEVLCINDGSTDKSQDVVDEFIEKDKRFKSYIKENGGLSDARNFGLKLVNTDYVMFVDSDDFCELDMVSKSLEFAENNNLDMVVFNYNQYNIERDTKEEVQCEISEGIYSLIDNPEILSYTPNAAWNKLYRTRLFFDNSIEYPYGYRHQDLGTTAKLIYLSNKVGFINEALYNYLADRPNNITSQIDSKAYHIIDMMQEIIDYYIEKEVFNLYEKELKYLFEINVKQSLRKIVTLHNKVFVFKFINDVFNIKRKYFWKVRSAYNAADAKTDFIYNSRALCKLYYIYKMIGRHV